MHAISTQVVCLLIAQFGQDGGFLSDQPTAAQPAVSAAAEAPAPTRPGSSPQFRQPGTSSEQTEAPAASQAAGAPTVPLHSRSSLARAEALVEQFIRWDPESLEGKSVTLLECVQRAANTGQQSTTISAYWELCTAIGRYVQAEHELVALAGISPQFEFEQTQIRAAQRNVDARRAQARVDLLAAQEKLAELARLPDETLPLPADRPFVGKYHTRLTTMYAGRTIPRQIRSIDRALPHQLKLIEQRAEAVDANARLMNDLAELYVQGQVPLAVLLASCKEWTDQQDAFLRAVVAYNRQIATYSQAVVGNRLPAESLVSTLIRQPPAATPQLFRDGNVLPAAARQPDLRTAPGAGGRVNEAAGDVRPAFEPNRSRQRFEPGVPAGDNAPPFDPNGSFQINDAPP